MCQLMARTYGVRERGKPVSASVVQSIMMYAAPKALLVLARTPPSDLVARCQANILQGKNKNESVKKQIFEELEKLRRARRSRQVD